jgi:hypothetical protein
MVESISKKIACGTVSFCRVLRVVSIGAISQKSKVKNQKHISKKKMAKTIIFRYV